MDDVVARLRPSSVVAYTRTAGYLRSWLESIGVGTTESVTAENLWGFRAWVVAQGWRPSTVRNVLAIAKAQLVWWRRGGLVPLLTQDAIQDRLSAPSVVRSAPVAYTPEQLRGLLSAALEHGWGSAVLVSLHLLLGLRAAELRLLTWDRVLVDAPPSGEIRIGADSKTHRARVVDLCVSPAARLILRSLPRRAPRVCPWARTAASMRHRRSMIGGPPGWTWQTLRETAASYLVCAPGIWGSASAYRTARQLGHSVAVSERHYMGLLRGIPDTARTLEAAMGIESELARVVAAIPR